MKRQNYQVDIYYMLIVYSCICPVTRNCMSGVMGSMLALSVVDCGLEPS
jgi:hypothetical protein